MNDEMDEIIREFITEAEELLDKIEPRFVELEQKGQNTDLLNDIFRSMHTIKGAAGFLGFQSIVDVAHASENIMKKLRDGEIRISRPLMDGILKSIDMLRLLFAHLDEKDGVEEDIAPLVQEMNTILQTALSQDECHEQANISHGPDEAVSTTSRKSESSILDSQEGKPSDPENLASDKTVTSVEHSPKISDVRQTRRAASAEGEQKPHEVTHTAKDTIHKAQNLRVDVNRIDKVMDLAGEVVLVRNRLLNISNYFDMKYTNDEMTEILMESVSFLDRITSDMQVAVMKMRMQPINKVLSKFPRLVRDMSASVKKDVVLQIFGERTEVDKTVIENIGDPLTHILRNSIDHGIESADVRTAKGKSPKGNIIINTYQKGTQIVIEIIDDGNGIEIEELKRKAVEKGLVTQEGARKMSDKDAIDIIFLPGFSTKDVASELSGRGVGMDVVKTNISHLNGYVEVSTEKGLGTTFKISIPLTLAIIQSLMVEVGGSKYAIPLSPIEETLKISKADINNITGQNVIVVRDRVCPLFDLNNLFGIVSDGPDDPEYKHLIVISLGDKKFCLAVDRLVGQEEVVIKTLNGLDAASSYVLGATITGDGKVVFILDVAGISRSLLELSKV